MNYGEGRCILKDTILICPKCRTPQAKAVMDVWVDSSFDWRCFVPLTESNEAGVSGCCRIRYVTLEGVFFTEFGAI